MLGEIAALFYRYKTAGGYDYLADYLVGPRSTADAAPVSTPAAAIRAP